MPDREVHIGPLHRLGAGRLNQDPRSFVVSGETCALSEAQVRKVGTSHAGKVGLPDVARRTVMVIVITHAKERLAAVALQGVRVGRNAVDPRAVERQEVQGDRRRKSTCLLYTSPSPRDGLLSRMPSSA